MKTISANANNLICSRYYNGEYFHIHQINGSIRTYNLNTCPCRVQRGCMNPLFMEIPPEDGKRSIGIYAHVPVTEYPDFLTMKQKESLAIQEWLDYMNDPVNLKTAGLYRESQYHSNESGREVRAFAKFIQSEPDGHCQGKWELMSVFTDLDVPGGDPIKPLNQNDLLKLL